MSEILSILANFIINIISQTGLVGIFILMTIESALIPLPSEVTMPFSGFLVSQGKMGLIEVAITGALGNLTGSILAYTLGWWGEEKFVRSFIKKYGKYLLLSEHEYDKSESWFRKYGQIIVFGSRLLPGVRTFISLPAGVAKMNFKKFCIFTLIGSFLWSLLLTFVGVKLGENWETLGSIFHKFDALIAICLGILVVLYINKKIRPKNSF